MKPAKPFETLQGVTGVLGSCTLLIFGFTIYMYVLLLKLTAEYHVRFGALAIHKVQCRWANTLQRSCRTANEHCVVVVAL